MRLWRERLRHPVREHVVGWTVDNDDALQFQLFAKVERPNSDVFSHLMVDRIYGNSDCRLVVLINHGRVFETDPEFLEELAEPYYVTDSVG